MKIYIYYTMKIAQVIELLKSDINATLDSLTKESIYKIIERLSKHYYEGKELVSDTIFDYIKEYYERKYEKIDKVGYEIADKKEEIILPYYMGSLDKIKPTKGDIDKWKNKYNGPYIISYKLDGISSLLYKKDNKIYLTKRGNGHTATDISRIIPYINLNKYVSKLKEGEAIRGELIISKNNFNKLKDKMATALSAVNGLTSSKTLEPDLLKLIDFVGYWVINPNLKFSEQLEYIKSYGIDCVSYKQVNKIDIDILGKEFVSSREISKYKIDGLVIVDDSKVYPNISGKNPPYAFAFKQALSEQTAETVVIDVLWEISKDGYIKPKVEYETIQILGHDHTYATAFNAKYIVDNKIGPGAKIEIIKSGDVIPYINKIIESANKPSLPKYKYIWNSTGVDIIVDKSDKNNKEINNKIMIKQLDIFFKTLEIDNMGEGTITKFVDNGYDNLWKILQAKKKDLIKIDGFGSTLIDKIYSNMDNGLVNKELYDVMAASQVFGRGIGSDKLKPILDDYPNILEIYKTEGKDHVFELINNINGFADKTTTKIVDNIPEFIKYLDQLQKIKPNIIINNKDKDKIEKNKKEKSKYSDKNIVFTGFRDKELEKKLVSLGALVKDTVSSKTDILIAIDPNENSSKITKAKSLNIEIISKEEFIKDMK